MAVPCFGGNDNTMCFCGDGISGNEISDNKILVWTKVGGRSEYSKWVNSQVDVVFLCQMGKRCGPSLADMVAYVANSVTLWAKSGGHGDFVRDMSCAGLKIQIIF